MPTKRAAGASRRRKPRTARPKPVRRARDAIAVLKSDHAALDALLAEFASADRGKGRIAGRICAALTVHATIEEEIFYPAARHALAESDAEALLDEAEVEHDTLRYLIEEIRLTDGRDGLLDARVKVLGEYVKHHVDEEHAEMFPKVKRSGVDLKALGDRLERRKRELEQSRSN